jgi:bifunctional non-homologous end joining protein LigD
MSLTDYRRKRRFDATREPEPGRPAPKGRRAIFVVQLHHASHRHYDFRLQIGDALKSWAVPKGPSFDPSVKRLAAEVEDHPVAYADFEGDIPKGQYGGGHVALYDRGVWTTQGDAEAQLAKGHLKFELFGERLKGGWHLVRSGRRSRKPEWLLFKAADAFAGDIEADDLLAGVTPPPDAGGKGGVARGAGTGSSASARTSAATDTGRAKRAPIEPEPPGKTVATKPKRRRIDWARRASKLAGARAGKAPSDYFAPQLATLANKPPVGEQWLHELKWDGYRLVTAISAGKIRMWSRNAIEWTHKVPDIIAAIERLGLHSAALDGELVAQDGRQSDFGLLQATLSGEKHAPLAYVIFDVLHVDGIGLERVDLAARKGLLEDLLKTPVRHLAYSSHIAGDGGMALKLAEEQHFEGIISKRGDRPHRAGRSDEWRKTKRVESDEFAVVGYTAPKGSRSGFGALLLARPDAEHGWLYAGRVGSGFSDDLLAELGRLIGKSGGSKPSVHVRATDTDLRSARWFAPKFVVEVYSRGLGNQGLLRQPSLKAVRPDKKVGDLADSDHAASSRGTTRGVRKMATKKETAVELVRLTHPDRIVYPDAGITKRDVADYYMAVADRLLAEIGGRPLSIIRCPGGSDKACFFQKHHTAGLDLVGTVRLKEESGNQANYLVVNDVDALMELVQFNALEFHPWGAKADVPERADRLVFDLDPGPDVSWPEIKAAARQVRGLLEELELNSFLRSTGGKGLHVVVPLNPGCEWPLVKRFARGFAEALAGSEPLKYLAVASKKLRRGRIFIDYLRNTRGATSIASYSLRARPGAPVAVPLAWSELARLKRPDAFDIHSVPKRLARLRSDPWDGIAKVKQDLSRWAAD